MKLTKDKLGILKTLMRIPKSKSIVISLTKDKMEEYNKILTPHESN